MASIKIPEQKVILCGEFGVGKSSIFRRYMSDSFVSTADRQSTLGLDHYDKTYQIGDKEIKVRILEFVEYLLKSIYISNSIFFYNFIPPIILVIYYL